MTLQSEKCSLYFYVKVFKYGGAFPCHFLLHADPHYYLLIGLYCRLIMTLCLNWYPPWNLTLVTLYKVITEPMPATLPMPYSSYLIHFVLFFGTHFLLFLGCHSMISPVSMTTTSTLELANSGWKTGCLCWII